MMKYIEGFKISSLDNSPVKVMWHQKVIIRNMITNCVYSAQNLKLYMY